MCLIVPILLYFLKMGENKSEYVVSSQSKTNREYGFVYSNLIKQLLRNHLTYKCLCIAVTIAIIKYKSNFGLYKL